MRGLICGPKLAACGVVLSAWGVVMLTLLGVFFTTHSVQLIEDIPLRSEDLNAEPNPLDRVYLLYNKVGSNCFIAAAFYVMFGVLSCCQVRLNQKKEYLVH